MTIFGLSLTLILTHAGAFAAGVILRSVVRTWLERQKGRFAKWS